METFELRNEHIELNKLLKLLGWAPSGGQAKLMIQDGEVSRNGTMETRVRAKLIAGDRIEWNGQEVLIKQTPPHRLV